MFISFKNSLIKMGKFRIHFGVRMKSGWGIRLWTKGLGYIAPGNNGGVEIKVKGMGHGIMISSKDPEALLRALS